MNSGIGDRGMLRGLLEINLCGGVDRFLILWRR